ncbi:hypothetical protein KTO58_26835 [Chitinophaga pendula]|uniref:hypothetical protein n=1 Tax=Chitinophaga TaxID=79328 RepID=UPI000BAEF20C|nr:MULTISPECIES: hypothetical protein [Chitinophaga]ASZ09825.1 hypothetical protein CK934_01930 [Chitinophaga sp. MD30]UCJ07234.1 hypothetical protein KTO58_26835 [Chitinophaga pendula]
MEHHSPLTRRRPIPPQSTIPPADCTTFILGFVDAGIVDDKDNGVYFIDTSLSNYSVNEGTNQLSTRCRINEKVAWVVYPFDPRYTLAPSIAFIGSGDDLWTVDPGVYTGNGYGNDNVFTGQLTGQAQANSYDIEISTRNSVTGNSVAPVSTLELDIRS